jgi:MYXO-CTERM domain-containing protein
MLLTLSLALAGPPKDPSVPYCDTPKALYAWNCATGGNRGGHSTWWHLVHDTNGCGATLTSFATAHRFQRVYLYVGAMEWDWEASFSAGVLPEEDAVAALTTRLRAAGIEPWALWYLNDDPDDFDGAEHVTDIVAAVAAFDARHPDGAFAGLHGDQEPNDRSVYPDYVAMNQAGLDAATAAGLGWAASLKPAWISTPPSSPFVNDVLPTLSFGTLMDYTDDAARAASQGETFLTQSDAVGVDAEVALETGWGDPTPGVSFVDLVREDPIGFYTMVGELDSGFSAHPTYRGIAIHDFAQYFADLDGGVEPYDATVVPEGPCAADTGSTDTGSTDTGSPDTGTTDTETGITDSAGTDTGSADTGSAETGSADTGGPKSGGCGCGTEAPASFGLVALAALATRRRR